MLIGATEDERSLDDAMFLSEIYLSRFAGSKPSPTRQETAQSHVRAAPRRELRGGHRRGVRCAAQELLLQALEANQRDSVLQALIKLSPAALSSFRMVDGDGPVNLAMVLVRKATKSLEWVSLFKQPSHGAPLPADLHAALGALLRQKSGDRSENGFQVRPRRPFTMSIICCCLPAVLHRVR
jgi:hypothetical protein